jgi:hypothetical protein
MTDSFMTDSVKATTPQAYLHSIYNENNYLLASIAGSLVFYEPIVEFTVPDNMFHNFEMDLAFDSIYMTDYTMKVI